MSLKVDNVRPMKQLCYVVRGVFNVKMESKVSEFPFEDLRIIIKIGVGADKCKFLNKDAYIYFNNRLPMKSFKHRMFSSEYFRNLTVGKFYEDVDHLRMFNLSKYRRDDLFALDFPLTKCKV